MARIRLVAPNEVPGALAGALDGSGEVLAPLSADPAERAAALAMLRPDIAEDTPDALLVAATSGSTGRPKGVVLSRGAVVAAAAAAHARLGGGGQWTCVLPMSYVAGLMVLARSHLAGFSARVVGDGSIPPAEAGVRSYISVVPAQLHRALAHPPALAALATYEAVLVVGLPWRRIFALLLRVRASGWSPRTVRPRRAEGSCTTVCRLAGSPWRLVPMTGSN